MTNTNDMNVSAHETPMDTSMATGMAARQAGMIRQPGWLWVSAGVLAALIVVQGGAFFGSTAQAEMATTSGSYSIMTTDGGNDEILVVVDSRQEALMVYRTFNSIEFKMIEREELSSLFSRARARSIGRP